MAEKFKKFPDLSMRQKRRRLSSRRHKRNCAEDSDDSDNSSHESSENEILHIPAPPVTEEDDLRYSSEEQLRSDNGATESSNEEHDGGEEEEVEEMEANDRIMDTEEENHESGSDISEAAVQLHSDDEAAESSNAERSDEEEVEVEGVEDNERIMDSEAENDESGSDISEAENILNPVPENRADLSRRILKNSFLAAGLKHTQGNILLKTLRAIPFSLIYLPKDTRTLLQTPTGVASRHIQELAGGEYLHIGFKATMMKKLESVLVLPPMIDIDFSTDGAKVDKGPYQFWPHQYRILNIGDRRPIIAGVFKGKHKPENPFDFYGDFVQEIIDVREQGGISVRNQRLPLNVRCFIADAPARAFALNHYGHTSSNACSKCTVEGHRCTVAGFGGTMVFQGIRHPLRTDEGYRNLLDEDHHKGRSPLAPVLGLVTKVPFEGMHLVWLGNVKKIFSAKIQGKYGHRRLNGRKLDILDSRMLLLKDYCPSEFNRRPNVLTQFHNFKATEFRQLLLYTAPAILQNVFDEDYYQHLMILHCVMRLLVSEETPRDMYAFCQEALEGYVLLCEQLYGEQFLSYNVHALLHVVSDVTELGSLESFSAFPYENNMPTLRKFIRKPHLTLQQVYKRICELNNAPHALADNHIRIRVSQSHADGPLPENLPVDRCRQFRKLEVGKFTFATTVRDSCCALTDSRIYLLKNIVQIQDNTLLIVQEFRTKTEIYNVGLTSDLVGVYRCTNLSDRIEAVNLNEVKSKVYRMPEWSNVEGEEQRVIENAWICVSLLTPIALPQN